MHLKICQWVKLKVRLIEYGCLLYCCSQKMYMCMCTCITMVMMIITKEHIYPCGGKLKVLNLIWQLTMQQRNTSNSKWMKTNTKYIDKSPFLTSFNHTCWSASKFPALMSLTSCKLLFTLSSFFSGSFGPKLRGLVSSFLGRDSGGGQGGGLSMIYSEKLKL